MAIDDIYEVVRMWNTPTEARKDETIIETFFGPANKYECGRFMRTIDPSEHPPDARWFRIHKDVGYAIEEYKIKKST